MFSRSSRSHKTSAERRSNARCATRQGAGIPEAACARDAMRRRAGHTTSLSCGREGRLGTRPFPHRPGPPRPAREEPRANHPLVPASHSTWRSLLPRADGVKTWFRGRPAGRATRPAPPAAEPRNCAEHVAASAPSWTTRYAIRASGTDGRAVHRCSARTDPSCRRRSHRPPDGRRAAPPGVGAAVAVGADRSRRPRRSCGRTASR